MKASRWLIGALALCLALAGAATAAEIAQKGNLRVSFSGEIAPRKLPRTGSAPVSVSLAGDITTTDGAPPPQLRTITMEINRHGIIDGEGIPTCRIDDIQPASTAEARQACSRSLVGTGLFEANVALPEQSPFPSDGRVLAFYGKLAGKPTIFAHIYGTEPLPTSFTLPFQITHKRSGTYSAVLSARLPRVAAEWGYVSGVSLQLSRTYSYRGEKRSFVSAGCPAPKGFPGTSFTFARASFGFEGGKRLGSTMTRSCGVREQKNHVRILTNAN
jgi:hypothetical protein